MKYIFEENLCHFMVTFIDERRRKFPSCMVVKRLKKKLFKDTKIQYKYNTGMTKTKTTDPILYFFLPILRILRLASPLHYFLPH